MEDFLRSLKNLTEKTLTPANQWFELNANKHGYFGKTTATYLSLEGSREISQNATHKTSRHKSRCKAYGFGSPGEGFELWKAGLCDAERQPGNDLPPGRQVTSYNCKACKEVNTLEPEASHSKVVHSQFHLDHLEWVKQSQNAVYWVYWM